MDPVKRQMYKSVATLILGVVFIGFLCTEFVFKWDVFSFTPSEQSSSAWEAHISKREKMNLEEMKKSYGDLMAMGMAHMAEKKWNEARINFLSAKCLFPDRISARKNLCYTLLMKCQEDWRYCDHARKELYYAMKYVDPNDPSTFNYLSYLVDLVGMEEIVEMDEDAALAAIF